MGIIVQGASNTDIARACEIEVAAYANNAGSPVLFPGPFATDSTKFRADDLIQKRKEDPTIRYVKAVDEETGEQLAFAKWHIYETSEAASAAKRDIPSGPGSNPDACKAFFGGLAEAKRRIIGDKPHVYLHLLHTDPKFQRRGAGSALMKSGLREADRLNLPLYLESSPEGHPFYLRHGMKDIEEFPLHLGQYGGEDKVHITSLMLREAHRPIQQT